MTCGKVIGDKWTYYNRKVTEMKDRGEVKDVDDHSEGIFESRRKASTAESESEASVKKDGKLPRGKLLDDMGLTRICCRRHLLAHTDLIDII